MPKDWTVTTELSAAERAQVFSGGACNVIDGTGALLRNEERDAINNWLSEKKLLFFDPQIHPDTHGYEYDYHKHHPIEIAARRAARVRLYEVSPRSFGGITSFEIALDHFRHHEAMVIYYSDGNSRYDIIPEYSDKGHPLFIPDSIDADREAMRAHYKEFIKNANNMRKYIMGLARTMDTMTVAFTDSPASDDVIITPDRMHAADLFKAAVRAASNQRVYISFTGTSVNDGTRDNLGNPRFVIPDNPPEIQMQALLDQYVDEGNQLRRAIAEMVNVSVFVRVVYTQKSAILALDELLTIKKITGIQ